MDLTALLLACSLHPDDGLLDAIVYAYSAGTAYAVINVDLAVLDSQDEPLSMLDVPRSVDAARAEVNRILGAGGEPVLGLLPVRLAWGEEFGKTLEELWEPCINVAVASAKLSEFDHECRALASRHTALARRACTLERYGRSLSLPALPRVVLHDLARAAPQQRESSAEALQLTVAPPLSAPTDAGLFFRVGSNSGPVLHPGSP